MRKSLVLAWGLALACTSGCSDGGSSDDGTSDTKDPATAGDGTMAGHDAPKDKPHVIDESASPVGIGDETGFGFTPGAPIDLSDASEWKWVGVDGAYCQDKSSTGFFVKKGSVDKLIIYLEGGGACFNKFTCLANPQTFGPSDLSRVSATVLDTTDDSNPFKDWNKVFIGYCSGDIYSGSKTDGQGFEGRTQQGFINVGKYLERIVPSFPNQQKVLLTGSSAGGFGSLWNFFRTQEAFGKTRVALVDDSGPAFGDMFLKTCMQKQVREIWGWDATLPPDCEGCFSQDGGGIIAYPEYLFETFKGHRFGLMSTDQDAVIRQFFGFGTGDCKGLPNMTPEEFQMGLADMRERFAKYPNFVSWVTTGMEHTYLMDGDLDAETEGVAMKDWLMGVVGGGENFLSVGP